MAKLKGVIFGVENVLLKKGDIEPNKDRLAKTGQLVRFLRSNDIDIVVLSNRDWVIKEGGKVVSTAQEQLQKDWGVSLTWYRCAQDGVPAKQSGESIKYVCKQKGWEPNETLFIGNTQEDMQAAVNGKVMLLNAQWYEATMDYGFPFKRTTGIARFIDIFCLRDKFWAFRVEDGRLKVYTLATFSTMYDPFKEYSNDFRTNIKNELGHDDEFWAKYLCSSLYFSGLYKDINYVTSYPCHEQGKIPQVLIEPMTRFAKCFRGNYIPDLIVRHKTSMKSQTNRADVDHLNQLNTIHLNRSPLKRDKETYKAFPVKAGKGVLVIDDVCSKGMSFEAARTYIEATGGSVVSVALLKALKHGYERLGPTSLPKGAFARNQLLTASVQKTYSYRDHVISDDAARDLDRRLRRYREWAWPKNL